MSASPAGLRLLLVEDDDDDAVLIVRAIRQAGFDVVVVQAKTEEEFRSALDEPPDFVISDHSLPQFSSLAALASLKARGLDLPFIVVSGTIDEESAVTILRAGAHDFVTKQNLARLGPAIGRELQEAGSRAERRRAQRDLRIQRDFLRLVIDANPGLIFVKNADGAFTLANRAVADLYALQVDDLVGQTHKQVQPASGMEGFLTAEEEVIESGHTRFVPAEPLVDPRTGTTRWFETRMVPLIAPDGTAQVLGIGTEITQRRLVEEALRLTEEQFRHAQKMEAVGQLAGGVAHDFNNLLTAILGYSHLLADRVQDPDVLADLDEIRKAGERAESLTRQLLAFSRKQMLSPQVLDVNDVVSGVQKLLRRVIGESIQLETTLTRGLLRVRADRGQIEQALLNLAINARDAMSGGGTLRIETANAPAPPGLEACSSRGVDRCVSIVVADTGHGMSPEVRGRIFEPFFTTKQPDQGTGLGLSMVYGVVAQSGGLITVDSEPGQGSRFTLCFPPAEEDEARDEHRAAMPAELRGTETILLVEDEEAIRELVRKVLGRYGYAVLEAAGADDAIAIAERYDGPVHLLLTDVVMPRMPGTELARRLTSTRPETRVMYMSGFSGALAAGPDAATQSATVLLKPFTPEQLAAAVRDSLSRNAANRS